MIRCLINLIHQLMIQLIHDLIATYVTTLIGGGLLACHFFDENLLACHRHADQAAASSS
jgi:hypothetical protein